MGGGGNLISVVVIGVGDLNGNVGDFNKLP